MDKFAGTWFQGGQLVATISDDTITLVDGSCKKLQRHEDGKISMASVGDSVCIGNLDDTGRLVWSDGEIWDASTCTESSSTLPKKETHVQTFHQESARQSRLQRSDTGDTGDAPRSQRRGGSGGFGGTYSWRNGQSKIAQGFRERKKIAESTLLPEADHMFNVPCVNLDAASFLAMASQRNEGMRWGPGVFPKSPDDINVRVMVTESHPKIICLELASVATYNMMDLILSQDVDWATDVISEHIRRTRGRNSMPLAIEVQGAGLHFCPGGNPNTEVLTANIMSSTQFDGSQYMGYKPFSRIRELAVPSVQGSHGFQVGGGCAYALNCTARACDHKTSVSFGNATRGAVPGMMLSQALPSTIGLSAAVSLYLNDLTLSAYAASKADFMTTIYPGVKETKHGASTIARSLAAHPGSWQICRMIVPFDESRFSTEGYRIAFTGKTGQLFQNVKEKKQLASIVDLDDISSKATVRGTHRRANVLGQLAAKAAALHGPDTEGGILSMASYVANCCWVTLSEESQVQGTKDHPARYSTEDAKKLHRPARDLAAQNLSIWRSPTNKRGMRKIDVWQVAEVVAFCFWRDRDLGVEMSEGREQAPLSQLAEDDCRRKLLRNRSAVEADASVPCIVVNRKSKNPMHFEDPLKRFNSSIKADIWWQFLSAESGRTTCMLLVAALIGTVANSKILLTCDGEEVTSFNVCQGKYVGDVKRLAVQDETSSKHQISLLPRSSSLDWVSVRTVGGNETCIDLAAAQHGDMSRSECSGVPVIFLPADEFRKKYQEQRRDTDPIAAYQEEFMKMIGAREAEGPGRVEEFLAVLGKACALLGLV